MNYRHAYHAGNFADVVKHIILLHLLDCLKKKETSFAVLDTHAGTGMYDLGGDEAQKTGEYKDGISRLLAAPALADAVAGYVRAVRGVNPDGAMLRYPGSPYIAALALREGDRLIACELHPDDAARLKTYFASHRNVHVHARDGFEAMRAFLPFKEKRGLVLIDPPYENPREWQAIIEALEEGLPRFRQGVYAVWYPLKDPAMVRHLYAALAALHQETLIVEMTVKPSGSGGLYGTGMAIINPPWPLHEQLQGFLPDLARVLSQGVEDWRVEMLR